MLARQRKCGSIQSNIRCAPLNRQRDETYVGDRKTVAICMYKGIVETMGNDASAGQGLEKSRHDIGVIADEKVVREKVKVNGNVELRQNRRGEGTARDRHNEISSFASLADLNNVGFVDGPPSRRECVDCCDRIGLEVADQLPVRANYVNPMPTLG